MALIPLRHSGTRATRGSIGRMHNVFTTSNPLVTMKTPRICRKWLTIMALLFGSVLTFAQASPGMAIAPEGTDERQFPGVFLGTSAGQLYFSADHEPNSRSKVSAVLADRTHPNTIYVGVIDDKEIGGIFVTHDGGTHWQQMNSGLSGHAIFSLAQSSNGDVVAGTQRGIYVYNRQLARWSPANLVVNEKIISAPTRSPKLQNAKFTPRKEYVRAELKGRVARVVVSGERWYAATSQGVYASYDHGHSWHGGPVGDQQSFLSIDVVGEKVVASAPTALAVSNNHGETWTSVNVPASAGTVFSVAVSPSAIWISTPAGVLCSQDAGANWDPVLVGMPPQDLVSVQYDPTNHKLLGMAKTGEIYTSSDGQSWTQDAATRVRPLSVAGVKLIAVTP